MKISGIDHLELYVGDARQTAFYLCTAFGFTVCGQGGPETGLPGRRSLLLRQGGIQIVLTTGLVPDHPATEYVRRHGDGVAVIGIGVDDVAAAHRGLVERGAESLAPPTVYAVGDARVVVAEVSGFSDVTHRLVERRGPAREFLPGVIELTGRRPARRRQAVAHHRPRRDLRPGGRARPHRRLLRGRVRVHGGLRGVHRGRRPGHGVQGRAEPVRQR